MINAIIGNNLKNLREDRRLTQESIALKADICLTSYRDWERGRAAIINKHIPKIAEILEEVASDLDDVSSQVSEIVDKIDEVVNL